MNAKSDESVECKVQKLNSTCFKNKKIESSAPRILVPQLDLAIEWMTPQGMCDKDRHDPRRSCVRDENTVYGYRLAPF